jgi:hypothetical protein
MREPTADEEEALLMAQKRLWDKLRAEVVDRLEKKDLQMVQAYQKQRRVAVADPRVIFRRGDCVLLRRR